MTIQKQKLRLSFPHVNTSNSGIKSLQLLSPTRKFSYFFEILESLPSQSNNKTWILPSTAAVPVIINSKFDNFLCFCGRYWASNISSPGSDFNMKNSQMFQIVSFITFRKLHEKRLLSVITFSCEIMRQKFPYFIS